VTTTGGYTGTAPGPARRAGPGGAAGPSAPAAVPPPSAELLPTPVGAATAAALQAAATSLVAVLVPVVLTWVVSAEGAATWTQAVRFSLTTWLLAQHGGVTVDGGHVGLVPLGLAAVPVAACWFAGRRLARTLDPRADKIAAGLSRAAPAWPPARALAAFPAAYCLCAAAAVLLAPMEGARPIGMQAVLGAAAVASAAGTMGAATYRYGGLAAALVGLLRFLPRRPRCWLAPALGAVAVQCAAGALVVAAMLGLGRERVIDLHVALDPGVAGGAVLTAGQLALLPNLAVWAACVLAGPGFSIGAGTSVTVAGATLGPLPAVPLLGALPAPGPLPALVLLVLLVPVLAGAVGGLLVARTSPSSGTGYWRGRLALLGDAAGVAVVAGLLLGVLAWLSGGPAGPGVLAVVGPAPSTTAVAFGAEVLLGALVAIGVRHGVAVLRERRRAAHAAT